MEINYKEALTRAEELARLCPPTDKAFSVGAIVFDTNGVEVATGYSRETGEHDHAEEVALVKARAAEIDVRGGTMVCSMEPCGARASKPVCCADLVIQAGISTVVYNHPEPPTFIKTPNGNEILKKAGVQVLLFS